MGLSVIEQIAINVAQTLKNITTAAGYQLSISRWQAENTPAHLSGLIYQLGRTAGNIQGMDEWWQSFAVVVWVQPAEGDLTPVDSYNNEADAAIYTAIMNDYTRGGLAIDTRIQPTLYMPPVEGEFSGITFMFDVLYRTQLDKPYSPAI